MRFSVIQDTQLEDTGFSMLGNFSLGYKLHEKHSWRDSGNHKHAEMCLLRRWHGAWLLRGVTHVAEASELLSLGLEYEEKHQQLHGKLWNRSSLYSSHCTDPFWGNFVRFCMLIFRMDVWHRAISWMTVEINSVLPWWHFSRLWFWVSGILRFI